MKVECIADTQDACGENPLWHPGEKRLYWVDIPAGRLYRYDPAAGTAECCFEGPAICGFTLQADGALLLFMAKGSVGIWREGLLDMVIEELTEERETRFNDVIADPAGRVFCGTMPAPDRLGRLYRLDPSGSIHLLIEGIGCSNGLGFTPCGKGLYYIDTPKREIYRFDYDRATGDISHQRVFATLPEGGGMPDGMTVDAEGCLWVALWGGASIVRFSPEGREIARVAVPAEKVTCPSFGGEGYGGLFVTTAGGAERNAEWPGAGALFRLTPPVGGVPEFRSRIGLPGQGDCIKKSH